MNDRLVPIVGLLEISTNLYIKALAGVSPQAFVARPSPSTNSLVWIAGHLLQSRARLLRLVGESAEIPWADVFGPSGPLSDTSRYPTGDALLARWGEVTERLYRRLEQVDAETLSKPPGMRVPSNDGSLLGAVAFAAFHEAYHAGQMGYLRKWHGLSPLVES